MIDANEAARRLGFRSTGRIYQFVDAGRLTRHRDGNRTWFDEAEVEELSKTLVKSPRAGKPQRAVKESPKQVVVEERDPLDEALDELSAAIAKVKRARKAHDREVGQRAVQSLIEGLAQGLSR